jgi:hypothetical protein
MRTHLTTGAGGPEDDEAEYAWLSPDALKAFVAGDINGDNGPAGPPPADATLRECIAAADRGVQKAEADAAAGEGLMEVRDLS